MALGRGRVDCTTHIHIHTSGWLVKLLSKAQQQLGHFHLQYLQFKYISPKPSVCRAEEIPLNDENKENQVKLSACEGICGCGDWETYLYLRQDKGFTLSVEIGLFWYMNMCVNTLKMDRFAGFTGERAQAGLYCCVNCMLLFTVAQYAVPWVGGH